MVRINVFKVAHLALLVVGCYVRDFKDSIKDIISKLTLESRSVFSQKVFSEAGEIGIGEDYVANSIRSLKDENFICEPIPGVLKRNV